MTRFSELTHRIFGTHNMVSQTEREMRHTDNDLKARVAKKARSADQIVENQTDRVARECIHALTRIIDTHMEGRNFEEAVRWVHHARSAMPDRPEFEVKTAEVFYRARDIAGFLMVAQALKPVLVDHKLKYWAPILHMGRKLTPDHELFSTHTASATAQHVRTTRVMNSSNKARVAKAAKVSIGRGNFQAAK